MRRYHYWIIAKDEQGRPYLIYGGTDEETSRQKGLEMLAGLDFEIKKYPTRDLATASAFYRGVRLERGEGLRGARQRIGHDKSLRRMKHRNLDTLRREKYGD